MNPSSTVTTTLASDSATSERDFIALYTNYRRLVSAHLRRFIRNDRDLVEDLTQDTFLRLWQAMLHRQVWIAGSTQTSSFLCRIATNLAIDMLRRKRLQGLSISIDAEREGFRGENSPVLADIEQALRAMGGESGGRPDEIVCRLQAISELPPREQGALRQYLGGAKIKEIADQDGISKSHMARVISRAARHVYDP